MLCSYPHWRKASRRSSPSRALDLKTRRLEGIGLRVEGLGLRVEGIEGIGCSYVVQGIAVAEKTYPFRVPYYGFYV